MKLGKHPHTQFLIQPSWWIRFAVAFTFLLAGIQKWLFSAKFAGFFAEIGIPFPETSVLFFGIAEIICGSLILFNLHVKAAILPLFIIMLGALGIVKFPLVFDVGWFAMLNEARIDIIMIALLMYLWLSPNTSHHKT